MAWRLIEIEDADATEDDLTDSELIGLSVVLAHCSEDDGDVYHRAWTKIRPEVEKAIFS
jgi:hypothetical protein